MLLVFYLGIAAGVVAGSRLAYIWDTESRAHPRRPQEDEEFAARTMTAVRLADRGLDVSIPRADRLVIAPERLN